MIRQPKGAHLLLFVFLFFSSELFAQNDQETKDETTFYKRQIELHHDNDFALFTDYYYTTGSFINYRILLNQLKEQQDRRQLRFSISQEYFTPSDVLAVRIEDFDRPFAGYSALTSALSLTNEKRLMDFAFQMGVTGVISGAEGFQKWFHSTNESSNPSWVAQIDDAVHINFYGSYTRDWNLLSGPFGVYAAWTPSMAFGTKDIYIENQATFFFGKRRDLRHTMAYHQIGEIQPEFFFLVKFAYRYVMHDALLEGFLVGDNSIFVLDPVDHLFTYGCEGFYRKKRMEYRAGYNYASPRAPTTTLHTWITISIARNF
jgi:hypothetical protein